MMPLSGRSRIIQKSDNTVIFAGSPVRRIMFFVLFLLLGTTMILGINPDSDFSGPELVRTIGYGAVLLVLLGAAGWLSITRYDRDEGTVEKVTSLFGVNVSRQLLTRMDQIEAVVMQKAALFHDDSSHSMRSGVFGNLFEPRSVLLRLFIETENERIRIDDGGEEKQLEETGTFFAQFLGVEFLKEEIET